jgi:phage shock protein C
VRERLYRSRSDRMLFGVAGGMAEWLDMDPAVVRLVWALLIVAGGVGLLLYIIAAIVVPEEPFELAPGAPGTGTAPAPGAEGTGAGAVGASDQARWEARRARRAARRQGGGNGAVVVGIVLVLAGTWFLLQRFIPALDSALVFPGVLIVLGIALLVGALGKTRTPGA